MKAAVVQINSTGDRDRNLEVAGDQVAAAAAAGADLVVLPEKWPLLSTGDALLAGAEPIDGPAITAARGWALEFGIHLLAGSFTEAGGEGELPTNSSPLISPEGELLALYRKIHMFDVEAGGVTYRESAFEAAGDRLVVAELPEATAGGAGLGLTICYDLRFPELYRALLDLGASLFAAPSAFTTATGRDHWDVLVRARAIENQAFVLAANQVGRAAPELDSWGHSMIVDPWGTVRAEVEQGEGFAVAEIDFDLQAGIRERLPALEHRRPALYGPSRSGDRSDGSGGGSDGP
ncbi:MAG: carbon-nitrogen hydrolase family protein [Solirubrobacterales bacterium]|nr:carbon-nitrogen hydrolase family protein [Solirubrobacterales bacterium]